MTRVVTVSACRSCGATPLIEVVPLGQTPLANSLLPPLEESAAGTLGPVYPLDLVRCPVCGLVQIAQIVPPEDLFSEYVYFSSNSDTMLRHARELASELISQERLGETDLVVEIASNDGYLLQYFKERGVPVLGIEPAANIARVAGAERGIPTLPRFFGLTLAEELARDGRCADVLLGANVLAHVPDVNDFVGGVSAVLSASGVAVFEVPYVADMLERVEFDTIYHEHQCYFSLTALKALFERHDLDIIDVQRLPIHGGTIRVRAARRGQREPRQSVADLLADEARWGVLDDAAYRQFGDAIARLRHELRGVLDECKAAGARIAAYGAAAKGVTLTSYCGIGRQYLDYVVDRSPHKQGKRFPVDGLPIYAPEKLAQDIPEYALLLTWNFADEILAQQRAYTAAGGRFIVPVPRPRMLP